MQKEWQCPTHLSNPSNQRLADEGGTDSAGNELDYIRNDQGVDRQFQYFVSDSANGITPAGLARLNQSIEAFVYYILGSQVNVRSGILEYGDRAKEAQREFLVLLEDAIRTPDI